MGGEGMAQRMGGGALRQAEGCPERLQAALDMPRPQCPAALAEEKRPLRCEAMRAGRGVGSDGLDHHGQQGHPPFFGALAGHGHRLLAGLRRLRPR